MNIKDLIIKHSAGNLYWKDRQSRYRGCNEGYAKIARLDRPEAIIGKSDDELFSRFLSDADIGNLVKVDQEVMESEKEVICEELGIDETGAKAYFLTKKVPLKNDAGEVIGLIGTSINITQQKIAQNKLQNDFISNMEHDLRTPFTGLWGLASLLHSEEEDPEKKENLGMIVESAQVLLDYCNDVLEFSRVVSQNDSIQNNKFNFKKMMHDIQKAEAPAAASKQLAFTLTFDEAIPEVLVSDFRRLNRILFNVVGNAIKFTKIGSVSMTAKLLKITDQCALVRVIVKDTGVGIDSQFKDYLFQAFSKQLLSNRTGMYKGLGVGLKVVKQYMDEIGGEIDLMSKESIGTEFILTIPFKIPLTDDYALNDRRK